MLPTPQAVVEISASNYANIITYLTFLHTDPTLLALHKHYVENIAQLLRVKL